ncbi:MAG: NYN domain-containing protein [Alphaproteobacteria bacterium]|nr:NYN domain-containing protein [Alphaproteobacteria bacterium]MDA7983191.1 NYN domain-containing protein [Alphaproteobacteria bacterium]MDA8002288.1 NYN domain-containing protein [Alphaproteobacteria bacterium]MDA8006382.1 NYN domain-containing protein [Alphaproteobacteria bacterium]MDA8013743.1 NYN domain-containing protein [Alphaproteobacteria bacterium]
MVKFYPQERIALFIDGVNSHITARELGFDIDFRKLHNLFSSQGRLVRCFYYTTIHEDQNFMPLKPLIDWLDYNGYAMTTRTVRDYGGEQGGRAQKRYSMDVDLAVDMMEIASHLDHAVLFSGAGGFRRLVEAVQRLGVRVTVVSTVSTQPPMIADDLRRQADNFLDLARIRSKVAREDGGHDRAPRTPRQSEEEEYEEEYEEGEGDGEGEGDDNDNREDDEGEETEES